MTPFADRALAGSRWSRLRSATGTMRVPDVTVDRANTDHAHELLFGQDALTLATVPLAAGHDAGCVFVNDGVYMRCCRRCGGAVSACW